MQPSMDTLNSPPQGSSKIRRRLDVESWGMNISGFVNLNLFFFLDTVNLHLIIFEAWWILNERAIYCFIIFFVWKRILT